MSYFPVLSAPGCKGWTTLFNFSPNNWEEGPRIARFLNASWSDGSVWQSRPLTRLAYGESRTINAGELEDLIPAGKLPLLSLTDEELPSSSPALITSGMPHTSYPNWRATLGLASEAGTRTCYQGEIDPFPAPGSLLTFGHFLQSGTGVENYLLFVNLESSPVSRASALEIRDAAHPDVLKSSAAVQNNSISVIRLDWPAMTEEDMPLLMCRGMSGIPLYFSRTADGEFLSLEHTHPPASSVVHGSRWEAHKLLKQTWFAKAGQP